MRKLLSAIVTLVFHMSVLAFLAITLMLLTIDTGELTLLYHGFWRISVAMILLIRRLQTVHINEGEEWWHILTGKVVVSMICCAIIGGHGVVLIVQFFMQT